ncbi:TRAP transporter substrate-binding protein [Acuticoccus sp. M5D2P5]|uniref:TRAP transporter substrate-binding protein n=1 Tax=Acuticoccus kalidii TaxID=2910977 RepID=UPI001F2ED0A6|nr:TRAP transporter substrate-binding protein [Acuticoccus kalidii]MCF3933158.1 TRAP transporter substrate-binding protein [Acuticoccus kalidii]
MAHAQDYTLKFAHILTTDQPAHMAAERFAELVAEKTDGRVAVNIFPAGELGNDTEIVEQIQVGAVDIGIPPTAKLGQFEPRMQLFDLPFIFPSPAAAYAVLDGPIGDELLGTLDQQGMHGLGYWESGFKQLTNNVRPIRTPEDLAGIKVRTMSSPLIVQQYETWGANPIPIAFSEVYNALQQGVAEGQENAFVSIDKMKFYEVQKYLTVSNHAYLGYAFVMNKAKWDAMPEELQSAVQAAFEEARDYERELNASLDDELKGKMGEVGLEVYELSPEDLTAFVEASKAVHADYAADIGQDLLDRTYKATEDAMK